MYQVRILFVCMDSEASERFKVELAKYSIDVVLCSKAEEAFHIIDSSRVDAVIFATDLPDMTGFEACRTLRMEHDFLEQPAIMYSSGDSKELRLASYRAGANIFIFEPILYDRLYYVLMLLVNSRLKYLNSVPLEQLLRITNRQLMDGREPVERVVGENGSLFKTDILRWAGILTQSINLSRQSQAIVREMLNLTINLTPRFGSIEKALEYLARCWEDTSVITELERVFPDDGKSFSLDVDQVTTDGTCAIMLMLCEKILSGSTPTDAVKQIAASGEVNREEIETLLSILLADTYMSSLFT